MTENDLSLELAPRVITHDLAALSDRVPSEARNLFIFGLGYTGTYIAQKLVDLGWRIGGTSRDPDTRDAMKASEIEAFDFSALDNKHIRQYDNFVVTIGPDRQSGQDPTLGEQGNLLAELGPRWIGYFSATSVYGEVEGWIDEASPTEPTTERGKRRLAVERAWTGWAETNGINLSLLRLAGIYGPGKNILEQLRAGTARVIDKPGHVFNRIHVEDIARSVLYRLATPAPVTIDNLADGQPMSQIDWTNKAAELLGMDAPSPIPFEQARASLSPMGLSFWSESRKIRASEFC
ncbi:MAG: SDR family NAD(P)-dependent oxidoreductase [Alphaproteobacteria bacterium]|nr:SDR family NAD(P)-dependent oxidoreductase [Alphaproteobacteria bacterium SS10]